MNIRERKELNRKLSVGEKCVCPSCGTHFVKETYQQVFCKSKSGTKCKDKYWNTVDPKKRNNTTRISPANAQWQANNLHGRNRSGYVEDYDPGDSEYWDSKDYSL